MIEVLSDTNIGALAHVFAPSPYNKPWSIFELYLLEQEQGMREVFVKKVNDAIVGYGSVVWHSPYAPFVEQNIPEIKDVNVLVGYRRLGYGKALIQYAQELVCNAGYPVIGIGVGVTPDYAAARSLYLSLGYTLDDRGVCPDEWGGAEYLTKKLS